MISYPMYDVVCGLHCRAMAMHAQCGVWVGRCMPCNAVPPRYTYVSAATAAGTVIPAPGLTRQCTHTSEASATGAAHQWAESLSGI